MDWIETPWGRIETPGLIPTWIACGRCGRCCRGFVLGYREEELETFYRWRKTGAPYSYPKDIEAIHDLFVKIPEKIAADGQSIYTCKAFDESSGGCPLFADKPEQRPIACWAFPYIADIEDLFAFSYPGCRIFQKSLLYIMERMLQNFMEAFDPIADRD